MSRETYTHFTRSVHGSDFESNNKGQGGLIHISHVRYTEATLNLTTNMHSMPHNYDTALIIE